MIPITESILIFHDFGEHHRLIDKIFIVRVPCPCCNHCIETHKIRESDLEFYKRFL